MKRNRISIILLTLILVFSSIVIGEANRFPVVKPTSEFYVYDDLGLIDQSTRDHIIDINKKLYQEVGAQVAVVVVKSLDGINKELYALEVFEQWEIGSRDRDNGILILIAPNEGQIWIETGYGLEGALPDSLQKRIIDEDILPFFKEGKYNDGILRGFEHIVARIEKEYNIKVSDIDLDQYTSGRSSGVSWKTIIILLLILFIDMRFFGGGMVRIMSRNTGRGYYGGPRPPRGGGTSSGPGSSGGGGRSGGGGAGGSW